MEILIKTVFLMKNKKNKHSLKNENDGLLFLNIQKIR